MRPHLWLRHAGPSRIEYGADYNPEQWPPEVWEDDVRAMREAGVTVVSLAIFSWARLEPRSGEYDFGWLDEVIGLLADGGILVTLATATASPPPWLTTAHPEILPVDQRGHTLWPGGRQHWRPTSPVFRRHALRLVRQLAARYGGHPALAAWHISNELGCHNVYDYSDDAARAFRAWLQGRYPTLDALNTAWGTAFWSQQYADWDEILPPRLAATHPNPTQQLDFKRFSSDALKDYLRAEREILREATPGVPVTTNFMVAGDIDIVDYADWVPEVDFVANDHYVRPGPQARDELSFSANLTGNLAGGRPWFLMEHSTSAVNWQPVNVAKKPGELARDSLTHVAHGADAVCFFQWRQSKAGAEKYHSAMLPHAGTDSELFRSVAALGARLRDLAFVAGTPRSAARAAIVFDWPSWWASEQDSHPSDRLRYKQEALDWYTAFLELGVRVDVVPAVAPLQRYDLVVAPVLHLVPAGLAARLGEFVAGGGHLVTTYFSGIVDEHDHVWPGGYPGALRELVGIRVQEFAPLLDGDRIELDNGTSGTMWSEPVDVVDPAVEVLASYRTGELAGRPAITRRPVGTGSASYVSTRLGAAGIVPVLSALLERAGVGSDLPERLLGKVELAVRGDFRFLINRTDEPLDTSGIPEAPALLPPRGVSVFVRRAPAAVDSSPVKKPGRIRGVMFDAGGVLTRPVGGRWNPRYDFESIVVAHHPHVREDLFPAAVRAGQQFLDDSPGTADRTDYHRTMLTVLGVDDPSEQLLTELVAPAAGPVIETYPDVHRVLDQLQRWGLRMSVVSDNWAGLEATFADLDIRHYFAGFVISEILGCRKPDPRMYAEGSRVLGLEPAECLFIDDDPDLVAAARSLGYHGVTLDRDARHRPAAEVIASLDELLVADICAFRLNPTHRPDRSLG